ncbi:MAG: hypothetical protein ACD_58C00336G0002 [uncultured bacterium]|nr:MAG: hypothetical protein ACD_58C00336G0002 [uncultured bacterium]
MKLVLDTNILISAIIFGGKPRIIFGLIIIGKIAQGYISPVLIKELLGVLQEKFKYSNNQLVKIQKLIKNNFILLRPKDIPKIIISDPFDNQILALAEFSRADWIISGDNHLLQLGKYKSIPIVTPHFFVDKIL